MAYDPNEGTSQEYGIMILDDSLEMDPGSVGMQNMGKQCSLPTEIQNEEDILIVPSGTSDSYCRLCLSEVDVEPLLLAESAAQPKQPLIDLVRKYVAIRLAPTQSCAICSTCRMMLEEFERFRERCLRCNSILSGVQLQQSDGTDQFECLECARVFATENHLKLHARSMHESGNLTVNGPSQAKKPRTEASSSLPLPPLAPLSDPSQPSAPFVQNKEAASSKPHCCTSCQRRFHFVGSLRRHVSEAHSHVSNSEEQSPPNTAPTPNVMVIIPVLPAVEPKVEPTDRAVSPQIPVKACWIRLERLDSSIQPIANLEISLGKFYYLRQQKALKQRAVAADEDDDDDLEKNYPDFFKSVRSKTGTKKPKARPKPEGTFQCPECSHKFTCLRNLNRHMALHTNNFPFPCNECPVGFMSPKMLETHKQTYHVPGGKPLQLSYCPYCSRAFCTSRTISKHIEIIHPEHLQQYEEDEVAKERARVMRQAEVKDEVEERGGLESSHLIMDMFK